MSKYLIISADDFGYNDEQNSAISELLSKGLITSTSILAVCSKSKDAINFAKKTAVDVGVHLTINSDNAAEKRIKCKIVCRRSSE